jgi:hypothetical protein
MACPTALTIYLDKFYYKKAKGLIPPTQNTDMQTSPWGDEEGSLEELTQKKSHFTSTESYSTEGTLSYSTSGVPFTSSYSYYYLSNEGSTET